MLSALRPEGSLRREFTPSVSWLARRDERERQEKIMKRPAWKETLRNRLRQSELAKERWNEKLLKGRSFSRILSEAGFTSLMRFLRS